MLMIFRDESNGGTQSIYAVATEHLETNERPAASPVARPFVRPCLYSSVRSFAYHLVRSSRRSHKRRERKRYGASNVVPVYLALVTILILHTRVIIEIVGRLTDGDAGISTAQTSTFFF